MKKYTVYDIEKLTQGKTTKYKLRKAIKNGELIAEHTPGKKRGRGASKYWVNEPDLIRYINEIEIYDFKVESINDLPHKRETDLLTSLRTTITASHQIKRLQERVAFLEKENSKLVPLVETACSRLVKEKHRCDQTQQLVEELAANDAFSIDKKTEIKDRLKKIK